MYRQGDILLVPCKSLSFKTTGADHCVIAEGEVTGHKHQIHTGATLLLDDDGGRYVHVWAKRADLTHDEHGTITLPGPGLYEVRQQREYTPEEVRVLRD